MKKRNSALQAKIKTVGHNGAQEAAETFRARKAIFSSSVSKNGEVYSGETSCMKRISVHLKNM